MIELVQRKIRQLVFSSSSKVGESNWKRAILSLKTLQAKTSTLPGSIGSHSNDDLECDMMFGDVE